MVNQRFFCLFKLKKGWSRAWESNLGRRMVGADGSTELWLDMGRDGSQVVTMWALNSDELNPWFKSQAYRLCTSFKNTIDATICQFEE